MKNLPSCPRNKFICVQKFLFHVLKNLQDSRDHMTSMIDVASGQCHPAQAPYLMRIIVQDVVLGGGEGGPAGGEG